MSLVTQIEKTEVLDPLESFKVNAILSIIVISGAVTIVAIFFSNSISKPIQQLEKTTKKIAKGDFDTMISIKGDDEITSLAHSFQNMTNSIKKNIELETKLAVVHEKLKKERFVTIGELSARLAHDIRNPLSTIKTSYDNLRLLRDDPENFEKSLKRSGRAIDRISHQVEGVMDFVKDSELVLESISLVKLVDSIISEMTIPDEIKINLPVNDVIIQADKVKLNSLFSNLIINAIQAMRDKGILTIRISEESNNEVKIEIENNGPSIPDENLESIFEPLFTTKQSGTGLGLASCKNIVKQHDGAISVKNNPVIFTVILPIRNSNKSKYDDNILT